MSCRFFRQDICSMSRSVTVVAPKRKRLQIAELSDGLDCLSRQAKLFGFRRSGDADGNDLAIRVFGQLGGLWKVSLLCQARLGEAQEYQGDGKQKKVAQHLFVFQEWHMEMQSMRGYWGIHFLNEKSRSDRSHTLWSLDFLFD